MEKYSEYKKRQQRENPISHKQLSDNAMFLASTYTLGSKLNKIYLQRSRREYIKSLIKFEWLWNKQ
jgi:hypothetical protein